MPFLQLKTVLSEIISQKKGRQIVLVRSAETLNTIAAVTNGWTDMRLSIKGVIYNQNLLGREQAHSLFKSFYGLSNQFKCIYTSDLSRSQETAQISLGFSRIKLIADSRMRYFYHQTKQREIHFGKHEKMPLFQVEEELQHSIYDHKYSPPEGEKWNEVKMRAINFLSELIKDEGTYLIYTHGKQKGLIWSLTNDIGVPDVISNASVVGMEFNANNQKDLKLKFEWKYPHVNKVVL